MNGQDAVRASRGPARTVAEVAQVIDRWVEDGVITPSQAGRLSGFLLFADDAFGWFDERALVFAASGTLLCTAGGGVGGDRPGGRLTCPGP